VTTKQGDIYTIPFVVFQVCDAASCLGASGEDSLVLFVRSLSICKACFLHPLRNVSCEDDRLEIPDAIKSNKSLCRIAEKCLLSDPSKRSTAARLCDMLVRVYRVATLRELATFLAKSYIFRLCLTILVILC